MRFENWTIEDLIARCADFDEMTLEMDREELAALRRKITELKQDGNSPVIPEGYVMVPKEPTDEMIAAAMNCDDVLFNSDESFCVQFGNIYEAMLAASQHDTPALNSLQSVDSVAGKWIPVRERMPEAGGDMIVFTDGIVMSGISYAKKKGFYIQALEYDNDEPVDSVTHWMPLPATPQEAK